MENPVYRQQLSPFADSTTAYAPTFDETLLNRLDSALCHPHQTPEVIPVCHLLNPVEVGLPQERQVSFSPLFGGLLLLYLVVVSLNRFRLVPISIASLKGVMDRTLPHLFLTDRSAVDNRMRRMQFVAIVLGLAVCLSSLLRISGLSSWTALSLAGCLLYIVSKMLFRFFSALLLDVETLSVEFVRRKWTVYYNVLLCLVPLAFVHSLYPVQQIALLFPVVLVVVTIFLFFSAISIFSAKMKSYGIFLYFCTLEIAPAACIMVYIIRSC